MHGIQDDVFLSLPCVVGRHGIVSVLTQTLLEDETKKLQESAQKLAEVQNGIKF